MKKTLYIFFTLILPISLATAFDFGSIPFSDIIHHEFSITNNSEAAVNVTKVRPSCVCLQILSYPATIAPMETGVIRVRLIPDKSGTVRYHAFVEMSDDSTPRILTVSGVVEPDRDSRPANSYGFITEVPAELITRAVTDRDLSFYVDPATILPDRDTRLAPPSTRDVTLVDVRHARAFDAVRIPGSLNIPLRMIRAKTFLRSVNVVVVDTYGGDPALEQACRELREQGFQSVNILRGGLNAWRATGGDLTGDFIAIDKLNTLSPADYAGIRNFSDWRVVYAGETPDSAALLLPETVSIPGRYKNILVVADSDKDYQNALGDLALMSDVLIFRLEGGLAEYDKYLRMSAATPGRQTTSTQSAQTGSTSAPSSRTHRKSCGGCSG